VSWRRIEAVETPWQKVEVWKTARAAELRAGGAVHAWWHQERLLTGLAWDAIAAAALLRPAGPPRSLLMLGVAGGTALRVLRHLLPDLAITGVELDEAILDLSRRHLALDALGIEIIQAEALAWLAQTTRTFDVVMDDCYLAEAEDVTRAAWTGERQRLLSRAVAPGGLLAVNLVNSPGHEATVEAVGLALRRSFAAVRRVRPPDSWNEVVVAGEAVLGGEALDPWVRHFRQRFDRRHWRRLQVEG